MKAAAVNIMTELGTMCGIKSVLATVWVFVAGAAGHPASGVEFLVMLMLADFILGFMRAWKNHDIRACKLKSGVFKFFGYWMTIACFTWAEKALDIAIPFLPFVLRDLLVAYLVINELFSCIDHLAFFRVPVPKPFIRRLRHYRHEILMTLEGNAPPVMATAEEPHAER